MSLSGAVLCGLTARARARTRKHDGLFGSSVFQEAVLVCVLVWALMCVCVCVHVHYQCSRRQCPPNLTYKCACVCVCVCTLHTGVEGPSAVAAWAATSNDPALIPPVLESLRDRLRRGEMDKQKIEVDLPAPKVNLDLNVPGNSGQVGLMRAHIHTHARARTHTHTCVYIYIYTYTGERETLAAHSRRAWK